MEVLIVINGSILREPGLNCMQGVFRPGFMGYPVSRKIRLPENWSELLETVED